MDREGRHGGLPLRPSKPGRGELPCSPFPSVLALLDRVRPVLVAAGFDKPTRFKL